MLASWFLALLAGAGQAGQGEPEGRAAFEVGLERVREMEDESEWLRADEALKTLLEEHREQEYVLHRLPELRADVTRIHFWLTYEEPRPKDLVSGELLKYSPSTGQIRIRYRVEGDAKRILADFQVDSRGLRVHPLFFDGTHSITLKGQSLDTVVEIFTREDLDHGLCSLLDPEEDLAFLAEFRGEYYRNALDVDEEAGLRRGQPYAVKLSMREGKATVSYNKKTLLRTTELDVKGGRVAFRGPLPDEILIEGRATTAWMQGLVSAAVDRDRSLFEQKFDPAAELPEWLLKMDKAAVIPMRFPFPGAGQRAHLRIWKQIEELLEEERYAEARQTALALSEEQATEAFREYVLAWVEAEDGHPEEALARLERVLELEPAFSGARVLQAIVRADQGSESEALAILRQVTVDDPLEVDAWLLLTVTELLAGKPDEAKATIDRALRAGIPPVTLEEVNLTLVRARYGPVWGETFHRESKNYHVASNLNRSICVEATKILEEALQLYRKDFPRLAPASSAKRRFPVYLFAGRAGYLTYAGDLGREKYAWSAGLYYPDLKQLLIWNVPDREAMLRTIRHEGFHQYLDAVLPGIPIWLNEGLAEYYEVSNPSRGFMEAGRPRADHLQTLLSLRSKWVPFGRFLSMSVREFQHEPKHNYAQAWGLAQFLMQSDRAERRRLDAYLAELAQGKPWSEAAEALLDGRDPEAFQREVRDYLVALRNGMR